MNLTPTDFSNELDADRLLRFAFDGTREQRRAGTPGEAKAFDYLAKTLVGFGLTVDRFTSPALIGEPNEGHVEVNGERHDGRPTALTPGTPPGGVTGRLVEVGAWTPDELARHDLRGAIVLSYGMPSGAKSRAADASGVLAVLHVVGERTPERAGSPVWGTPSTLTSGLLPKTPAMNITTAAATAIKEAADAGDGNVRVISNASVEWREIPTLIADLPGELNTFVLFSGHVDSWYEGAVDNGTATAAEVAIAELCARHRDSLRRGVRFAFWSGHEAGRYAGSTWYVDRNWQELYDRCICHVNIDSLGARNGDFLEEAPTMAETHGLAARAVRAVADQELKYVRMYRFGDQSFFGVGVSSIFVELSQQSLDAEAALRGDAARTPWWWHTKDDTFDKVDGERLLRDARVYARVVWELATASVLPFDFARTVAEVENQLRAVADKVGDHLPLDDAVSAAQELRRQLERWNDAVLSSDPSEAERNDQLRLLGRYLIPVLYSDVAATEQSLAYPIVEPLPGLSRAFELATLPAESDDYRFLLVTMLRERNRIRLALEQALTLVED